MGVKDNRTFPLIEFIIHMGKHPIKDFFIGHVIHLEIHLRFCLYFAKYGVCHKRYVNRTLSDHIKFKVVDTFNSFIPSQSLRDSAFQFRAYIGNRFAVQVKRFNPIIPAIHDILIALRLKDFKDCLSHSIKPICIATDSSGI
nr:MAG TPA: hypothetical protein [Caudoviricetes sp.]